MQLVKILILVFWPTKENTMKNEILILFRESALNDKNPLYSACIYSISEKLNLENNDFEKLNKTLKSLIRSKELKIKTKKSKYNNRLYGLNLVEYNKLRELYYKGK